MTFTTFVHDRGTLAARPAAADGNSGYYYFATDDKGGTWYRSTGSAWAKVVPPVGPVATVSATSPTLAVDILNALGSAGIVTVV